MSTKLIAIHQPNLFPWLGFFAKIIRSDAFVFLDHVILNPRTSIYTKRVKILANNEEFWLTIPLKNKPAQLFQKISEMEIENPSGIRDKHLKTMEYNYKKAPFFHETFPLLHDFYDHSSPLISERNIQFITSLLNKMGMKKELTKSSVLDCQNSSTGLLIEIVQKLRGTAYLSGDGADGYQENDLYKSNHIELNFMRYNHPAYAQFNTKQFVKGLSVIDTLMNLGMENTRSLLTGSPAR